MEKTSLLTLAEKALSIADKRGAFLTTEKEKINTMIIGWGQAGIMWGKPVFVAPVRLSRFTHEQLEIGSEFTVSVPSQDMSEAIRICGSKSGRDMDKMAAAYLKTQAAKTTKVPVIEGCAMHIECRVLGISEMELNAIDSEQRERWYKDGDPHTMYFGEILECY